MSVSTQPREEVFPGYLLVERIGSGGYAEVWRARAPGGIDKAVKIVYGCYDDQLAAQEMKAMERIKDVRHPFLLSLERFEVVDGRLAILTELADMSLEQRAQQCRAQGMPGIPRDELLRYLSDTAEALDYLAERHGLLHLDIKPANLLLSGEHVKVADFGLVKELATRTHNSMVAGMTPTYSAPEMFDDSPSPFSDQYSLAIVYQEMLTGVLPFPGRTAAQLANQHLRAQPQLAALSAADRTTVARALAKNPSERFPSCRALIKALVETAVSATSAAATPAVLEKPAQAKPFEVEPAPGATMPRGSDDDEPADSQTGCPGATQPAQFQPQEKIDTTPDATVAAVARPAEDIADVPVPDVALATETAQPTLYIAVGGIGIRVLNHLRDTLGRRAAASRPTPAVEMMAIDTDREELKEACSGKWNHPLTSSDVAHMPLRLPQEYRNQGRLNLDWLSHRWLYNIPRSLETRGYRALGRLALVDHLDRAIALVDRKLSQLAPPAAGEDGQPPVLRIVFVTGMGGGTGGGMVIDLANAARSRCLAAGRRAHVQCVFVCSCLGSTSASALSVANTYALLTELQFISMFGNRGNADSPGLKPLESGERPFERVYCVPSKQVHQSNDEGLQLIAEQLALASTHGASELVQAFRHTATPRELNGQDPLLLRTFAVATLAGHEEKRIDRLAEILARTIERDWLNNATPSEWQRLGSSGENETPPVPSPAGQPIEPSPMPVALTRHQPDEWRHKFAEHAATRFAYEVVSRICRESALSGAYRTTLLSSTDPAAYVALASQAAAVLGKHVALASELEGPSADESEVLTERLDAASHRVLTKLIDAIEQSSDDSPFPPSDAHHIVRTECAAIVEERLNRRASSRLADLSPAIQADAEEALARASADLLQCGCDRRTLIVVPPNKTKGEAVAALCQARPTAAILPADVEQCLVYCEGSGISPSSFARGFERVYPGIAEAASRHFTRTDIDWSAWSM